jgi:hypothetical protein
MLFPGLGKNRTIPSGFIKISSFHIADKNIFFKRDFFYKADGACQS